MLGIDLDIFTNPVIVYDLGWHITGINRMAVSSLGYEHSHELEGMHISNILHKRDQHQPMRLKQQLEEAGNVVKWQISHLHRNGWPVKMLTQFSLVKSGNQYGRSGYIESAVGLHDVPDTAGTTGYINENYSVLTQNIPGLEVFLIDHNMKIHSRLGKETFRQGWSNGFDDEKTFLDFFPPHIAAIIKPLVKIALESTPVSQEFEDDENYFSIRLIPLHHKGITSRCVVVLQNITETKLVENKLKLSKEESEDANRAKDNFVAKMSHEIRTPLNAISGFSGQLKSTRLTRKQQDFLQVIINSSQHLLSLIDDILVLSKIELGQIEIEEVPFKIPDIIHEVDEMLAMRYKEKRLEFKCQVSDTLDDFVMGDPSRLRQVLINLSNNAIKFTHRGSISLRCTLMHQNPSSKTVRFEVADTGIGISKNDIEKIFLPFHQVDTAYDRNYAGCGLGLPISRDLIEHMGGQLTVESTPGVGSNFAFTLEFKAAPQSRMLDNDQQRKDISLDHIRALFVDDDPINRLLGEIIMRKYNIPTDFVKSGLEAIKNFQPGMYDIVFLDINMPDINGMEVTRYIRQIESTSDTSHQTHIVAMTANAVSKHLRQYLMAGMDTIMLKPYDEDTLYRKVLAALDKETPPALQPVAPVHHDEEKGIDLDQLLKITRGDHDFTLLMLNIFSANAEKLLLRIRTSHDELDFAQIAEAAHTLAPSMEQIGLHKASSLLKKIEEKFLPRQNEHGQVKGVYANGSSFTKADHQLVTNAVAEIESALKIVKDTTKRMKRQLKNP